MRRLPARDAARHPAQSEMGMPAAAPDGLQTSPDATPDLPAFLDTKFLDTKLADQGKPSAAMALLSHLISKESIRVHVES